MDDQIRERLRALPSVDDLMRSEWGKSYTRNLSVDIVTESIRHALGNLRACFLENAASLPPGDLIPFIEKEAFHFLSESISPASRPLINATGVILHTNLGRAPLSHIAQTHLRTGYLDLELDIHTGKRSNRQDKVREICRTLTGCESATVVNNCAAATVITLRALAKGKEVVVSRGQLVEIGGSFRIPEIMEVSGAKLREVGTTNITRIGDYEKAIGPETGALMRVHTSNYRIRGFTEQATLAELIELGRRYNLPVIDDVGSGAFHSLKKYGLEDEPLVPDSLRAGADAVLFSGDKLLGGPQSGLILGKKEIIERIEKDPLMRAFRCDKMTLVSLETTLKLHRFPGYIEQAIPVYAMLAATESELRNRCEYFLSVAMEDPFYRACEKTIVADRSPVGGGTMADQTLPTCAVAVRSDKWKVDALARKVRQERDTVGRIKDDALLLDMRTVFDSQQVLSMTRFVE